tara:strand:- start:558 stop:929 length:372 start_codon:yes stop_codon:yes gene_type:complete
MKSLKINLTELTFETLKSVFSENYQTVSFTRMQEDGKEGNVYKDSIYAPSIYAGQSTEIRDEKDFDRFKKSHLKKKDELILILNPNSPNWFDRIEVISEDYKKNEIAKKEAIQKDFDNHRTSV